MNSQFVNKNAGKSSKFFKPSINKNKQVPVQTKPVPPISAPSPRLVSAVSAVPAALVDTCIKEPVAPVLQSPRLNTIKKTSIAAILNEDKENVPENHVPVLPLSPRVREPLQSVTAAREANLMPKPKPFKRPAPIENIIDTSTSAPSTSAPVISIAPKPVGKPVKKRTKLKEKVEAFENGEQQPAVEEESNPDLISIASLCRQKEKRKPRTKKTPNNAEGAELVLNTSAIATQSPSLGGNNENNNAQDNSEGRGLNSGTAPSLRSAQAYSGPRVRIVNGEITVDEDSMETQVDTTTTPTGLDISALNQIEENHDTRHITSNSFRTLEKPHKWHLADDIKFYRGLMKWGTDFGMIARNVFESKISRRAVKLKYNKEEKKNPRRIDDALNRTLDLTSLQEKPKKDAEEGEEAVDNTQNQEEEVIENEGDENNSAPRATDDPEYQRLMQNLISTARELAELEDMLEEEEGDS